MCRNFCVFICCALAMLSPSSALSDHIELVQVAPFSSELEDNTVLVQLENLDVRPGIQVELEFDPHVLGVSGVFLVDRISEDLDLLFSTSDPGRVHILVFDREPAGGVIAPGNGGVLALEFLVHTDVDSTVSSTPLIVRSALIVDEGYQGVPTSWSSKYGDIVATFVEQFDVSAAGESSVGIEWSVRGSVQVKTQVYRVANGRRIALLDSPRLGPGPHRLLDKPDEPGEIEYQLVLVEDDGETTLGKVNYTYSEQLPARYMLYANSPNPFNPTTRINFDVPRRSQISIKIFDIAGRHVATLVDDTLAPGKHFIDWHGIDAQGRRVASGTYFYQMSGDEIVFSHKMLLLK